MDILIIGLMILLVVFLFYYLNKASNKFWDKYAENSVKIKKVNTYEEGILLIKELYKLAFHPNLYEKVKIMEGYLSGKFNK